MHATLIFAALTLLPGLDPPSSAQTVPYDTFITVPEVEVRSGPSANDSFYGTSKLRKGEIVHVKKEEDGDWLAIEPPPGSISWIQDRLIEMDSKGLTAQVTSPEAPIRKGSLLGEGKMDVQRITLERGTSVVILPGDPIYRNDGTGKWIKIEAPERDYRYIPATAVKPAQGQVPVAPPAQPAPTPVSIARPEVASPQAATGDSLWFQAEQAERAGNPAEAERLFAKLANETGDHDLKIRCYNRIHFLREGRRPSYPTGYQPGRPNEAYYPNVAGQSRLYPTSANPYGQPGSPYTLTGRASSQYTYTREAPVPAAGQVGPVGYSQNPAPVPSCQWSGWGWLRRAPFFVDNKPAFVLENSQGLPRLYVTAQAGVSLESYVNRSVNLYGKMTYRGDLRTNYMTACRLTPLP
jgi:hypothetical protein